MPAAEKGELHEKVPFDVYAMMLIMAFLATAGAIAFLHDELQKFWYAGVPVTENGEPSRPFAVHLTVINEKQTNPLEQAAVEVGVVSQIDKDEYDILTDGAALPNYLDWPQQIHPLTNRYDPASDASNLDKIGEDYWRPLADEYNAKDATLGPDEGGGGGGAEKAPEGGGN
ncbi:MAG: hypothetical protein M5U26_13470 [Planctomycetota bacterium]|nr:hypothetical protein [Planctomycetota bacterium]